MIPLTVRSHAQVNRLSYFPFLLKRCLDSGPTSVERVAKLIDTQLTQELAQRDKLGKRGISDKGAEYLVEMAQDYDFLTPTCLPTAEGDLLSYLVHDDFQIVDNLTRSAFLSRLLHRNYALIRSTIEETLRSPSIAVRLDFYKGDLPKTILNRALEIVQEFPLLADDRLELRDLRHNVSRYDWKTLLHKFKPIFGFLFDLGFVTGEPNVTDPILPIPDSWTLTVSAQLSSRFMKELGNSRAFASADKSQELDRTTFELYSGPTESFRPKIEEVMPKVLEVHSNVMNPTYKLSDLHVLSRRVEYSLLAEKNVFVSSQAIEDLLASSRRASETKFALLPDRWGRPAYFQLLS